MIINLKYSVKNVGQRQVYLWSLKVDDLNKKFAFKLNPGKDYSDSLLVVGPNAQYSPARDAGTKHVVTYIY